MMPRELFAAMPRVYIDGPRGGLPGTNAARTCRRHSTFGAHDGPSRIKLSDGPQHGGGHQVIVKQPDGSLIVVDWPNAVVVQRLVEVVQHFSNEMAMKS